MNETKFEVKRMGIYNAELPEIGGSVQTGNRPVVVVQNDVGNQYSPTVIVVPLTSKKKKYLVCHVDIPKSTGLPYDSIALCEQIFTLPKTSLQERIGAVKDKKTIEKMNKALRISLGIEGENMC